uniref:uncharacterized protein LOC120347690 n=1 Tax=Styela clava TaxID=7725 RepID=UPI0019399D90|nr:uncharacterized protein LOC120347690 [Styela clava]
MNVATIYLLLATRMFGIEAAQFTQLKCFQFRYKLGQQRCKPKKGFKGDLVPCYNLCNKKLVKFEDCNKYPANMHCCVHDCRCVMKGAGFVEIPQNYTLSLDDEKISQWMKTGVEDGCEPKNKYPLSAKMTESENTKTNLELPIHKQDIDAIIQDVQTTATATGSSDNKETRNSSIASQEGTSKTPEEKGPDKTTTANTVQSRTGTKTETVKTPAAKCATKKHFLSRIARKMTGIFKQMGVGWEMKVDDGCN